MSVKKFFGGIFTTKTQYKLTEEKEYGILKLNNRVFAADG